MNTLTTGEEKRIGIRLIIPTNQCYQFTKKELEAQLMDVYKNVTEKRYLF